MSSVPTEAAVSSSAAADNEEPIPASSQQQQAAGVVNKPVVPPLFPRRRSLDEGETDFALLACGLDATISALLTARRTDRSYEYDKQLSLMLEGLRQPQNQPPYYYPQAHQQQTATHHQNSNNGWSPPPSRWPELPPLATTRSAYGDFDDDCFRWDPLAVAAAAAAAVAMDNNPPGDYNNPSSVGDSTTTAALYGVPPPPVPFYPNNNLGRYIMPNNNAAVASRNWSNNNVPSTPPGQRLAANNLVGPSGSSANLVGPSHSVRPTSVHPTAHSAANPTVHPAAHPAAHLSINNPNTTTTGSSNNQLEGSSSSSHPPLSVFIGNIPPGITPNTLLRLLSIRGTVSEIVCDFKPDAWLTAFVTFATPNDALRAVETLHNRRAFRIAKQHRLVCCLAPHPPASLGCISEDIVSKNCNNSSIVIQPFFPKYAVGAVIDQQIPPPRFALLKDGPPGANLFLYGIAADWTEVTLLRLCQEFGYVVGIRVPRTTSGRQLNKGFGFVSYDNTTSSARALASLNGRKFMGRALSVQLKAGEYLPQPMPPPPPSSLDTASTSASTFPPSASSLSSTQGDNNTTSNSSSPVETTAY